MPESDAAKSGWSALWKSYGAKPKAMIRSDGCG